MDDELKFCKMSQQLLEKNYIQQRDRLRKDEQTHKNNA